MTCVPLTDYIYKEISPYCKHFLMKIPKFYKSLFDNILQIAPAVLLFNIVSFLGGFWANKISFTWIMTYFPALHVRKSPFLQTQTILE